jgi:hypothetical protein
VEVRPLLTLLGPWERPLSGREVSAASTSASGQEANGKVRPKAVIELRLRNGEALDMFTALDSPQDKLDDHEKNFVAQVRKHGWFRTSVFDDGKGPGFSYTTGFWRGVKAPEIVVFSLKFELAHDVLWDIYRDVAAGVSFATGQRLSNVFANTEAVFLPVSKKFYPDYFGWSRWFYAGDDWPCLQLVWPDTNGTFPWEAAYEDRFASDQPNLTGDQWPAI